MALFIGSEVYAPLSGYAIGSLAQLHLLQGDLKAAQETLVLAGDNIGLSVFDIPLQFALIRLGAQQSDPEVLNKAETFVSCLALPAVHDLLHETST